MSPAGFRAALLSVALLSVALLAVATDAAAQPYPAPTRTAVAPTPAQEKAIMAAIALHDQAKFDEAIVRYQDVLKESPDNVLALFELAFSYTAKRDYEKSLETARKGAEYKSDLLGMFYDVMGGTLDTMGQPQRAIEAYRRGTELVPDAAVLYFNMAVTFHESLKDNKQARLALQQSLDLEPDNAEAHRLLGQIYQNENYKTPAALTLGRFLVLVDDDTRGALQGYGLWRAVLRGNRDPAMPNVPEVPSARDEGDFATIDAFIDVSHAAAAKEMDDGKPEIQTLIGQLDAIITRLAARDPSADRASFVGRHYVPYFVELKQKDFLETFAYLASQRAPVPGVREWLDRNPDRVKAFLAWSDGYAWRR